MKESECLYYSLCSSVEEDEWKPPHCAPRWRRTNGSLLTLLLGEGGRVEASSLCSSVEEDEWKPPHCAPRRRRTSGSLLTLLLGEGGRVEASSLCSSVKEDEWKPPHCAPRRRRTSGSLLTVLLGEGGRVEASSLCSSEKEDEWKPPHCAPRRRRTSGSLLTVLLGEGGRVEASSLCSSEKEDEWKPPHCAPRRMSGSLLTVLLGEGGRVEASSLCSSVKEDEWSLLTVLITTPTPHVPLRTSYGFTYTITAAAAALGDAHTASAPVLQLRLWEMFNISDPVLQASPLLVRTLKPLQRKKIKLQQLFALCLCSPTGGAVVLPFSPERTPAWTAVKRDTLVQRRRQRYERTGLIVSNDAVGDMACSSASPSVPTLHIQPIFKRLRVGGSVEPRFFLFIRVPVVDVMGSGRETSPPLETLSLHKQMQKFTSSPLPELFHMLLLFLPLPLSPLGTPPEQIQSGVEVHLSSPPLLSLFSSLPLSSLPPPSRHTHLWVDHKVAAAERKTD
ncbi:unnamed protein product [Pleuronectes platessa]|uniref:Uncharacterized protein n=1 Tax=Pleuronectes platessa TaxID=8262 RepID=A0A9N7TIH0_PLEPL|nr:unnamed protein product [Pleuronectes platessa]